MRPVAPFKNPLCLALDVDTLEQVQDITKSYGHLLGGIKLGPRFLHRYGARLVTELSQVAPIFVDCKYFDIPSTMEAALRADFAAGASACTVHALSGATALKQMAQLERELSAIRPFRIFVVTILTSTKSTDLSRSMQGQELRDWVQELCLEAERAGLSSFVCSTEDLSTLRQKKERYLVVPGLRFAGDSADDQVRVATPEEALEAGANLLVMGRSLLLSKDPELKIKNFFTKV